MNPQFFQSVLPPGFKDALKIPIHFSKYALGTSGNFSDEAVLLRNGKEWRISISRGYLIGHRWARFVEEYQMEPGDFVVFKHRGNLVFDVVIYDSVTQCRKDDELEHEEEEPRPSKKPRFEAPTAAPKSEEKAARKTVRNEEKGGISDHDWPYYTSTIKPYSRGKKQSFNIPKRFAEPNGLCEKHKMILENSKGRTWPVTLRHDESHGLFITCGWKLFADENGLKEGDSFKFQLVRNGAVPVARFTPV